MKTKKPKAPKATQEQESKPGINAPSAPVDPRARLRKFLTKSPTFSEELRRIADDIAKERADKNATREKERTAKLRSRIHQVTGAQGAALEELVTDYANNPDAMSEPAPEVGGTQRAQGMLSYWGRALGTLRDSITNADKSTWTPAEKGKGTRCLASVEEAINALGKVGTEDSEVK